MKFTLTTLFSFALINLFGQNYYNDFLEACNSQDSLRQKEILIKWERETPKDPELITSYYNYYFLKSRQEIVSLTTNQPSGESLVLKDNSNNTAGFLGSTIHYNEYWIEKAFSKINEGIKLYPNRLDMRFGKIHTLGQVKAVSYTHLTLPTTSRV